MKMSRIPYAKTLLLVMLLCASKASAGEHTRWPVGDVVVHGAGGSTVMVALDRTGDGVSEHLLILTTDRQLEPFSISGHARLVAKEGKLLFFTPGLELNAPALSPIRFIHLAEYGGSQGKVRLDAVERGDARADLQAAIGNYRTGDDDGPALALPPCALTCQVACNDGASCSVGGCPSGKCASCSCGGCSCVAPQ